LPPVARRQSVIADQDLRDGSTLEALLVDALKLEVLVDEQSSVGGCARVVDTTRPADLGLIDEAP
jgi:hypothetical protein